MTPQEQLDFFKRQLQTAADEKARRRHEADRNAVFQQIGQYLGAALSPLKEAVKAMIEASKDMKRISASVERISDINIPTPEFTVDMSQVPPPKVAVNPIIDIPDMKFPSEMNVHGFINLMGYDRGMLLNPLPVQLRDAGGNPIKLFENLTTLISGGGGGGFRHVLVDNLDEVSVTVTSGTNTTVSLVNADGTYYDSDNPLPVSFSASGTSQVLQVSGAVDSVNILQIAGNPAVVGSGYQDNALRVVHATDAIVSVNIVSGATGGTQYDDAGQADPGTGGLAMARDSAGSVYALRIGSGTSETALRVQMATDAIASVSIVDTATLDVKQVSGSIDSVNVMQIGGNAVVVGTGYQDNALRVVHATDAIASVNLVSATTVTVTGSLTSSVAVGPTVADEADDGNAPVQIGGIARTANPTAVAANDVVKATFDKIGRQIIRPVQVRDLINTAYVSLTTGTETTFLAGVASTFLDLIYVMGTNNSDAAVTVDLRSATGGGIVTSIRIPANGTAGVSLNVPIPQNVAADTWTADLPDITGTTVTLSALFSREV